MSPTLGDEYLARAAEKTGQRYTRQHEFFIRDCIIEDAARTYLTLLQKNATVLRPNANNPHANDVINVNKTSIRAGAPKSCITHNVQKNEPIKKFFISFLSMKKVFDWLIFLCFKRYTKICAPALRGP